MSPPERAKPDAVAGAPADLLVRGGVVAFDFGEKRIGVAVGDYEIAIAHPLATIHAEDNDTRFARIAELVAEWRPMRFVVGLPAHQDGIEHEMSRLARRFARRLEGRFGISTILVDERLSTRSAESRLLASGTYGDKLESVLDSAAAAEILQAHFEEIRSLARRRLEGAPE